jgi:hypothetical protein
VAAISSEYPPTTALVRGDPVQIPVNISVDGVDLDVSGYDWRSQIRTGINGTLVTEFTTSVITPAGGTVPSTVLLELDATQAQLLKAGQSFDVEQRDQATGETIRTWWIVNKLKVQDDVSNDALASVAQQSVLTVKGPAIARPHL